jgi:hypothetical protein
MLNLSHIVWQLMHNITVTSFSIIRTKRFGRNDFEDCQRKSSCSSTYGKFYEGGIDNSGLRNHSPPSVQPWLSHEWFAFLWTHEGTPERTNFERMLNSKAVSETGYPVWMKPIMLLASLICQDDERCGHIKREYLDKCESGNSDMYFFRK